MATKCEDLPFTMKTISQLHFTNSHWGSAMELKVITIFIKNIVSLNVKKDMEGHQHSGLIRVISLKCCVKFSVESKSLGEFCLPSFCNPLNK